MNKLKSFKDSGLKGGIEAELDFVSTDSIELVFQWNPDWKLKTAPPQAGAMPPLSRQNQIWESTCFEAFVKYKTGDSYLEFNIALDGRWNVYHFDSIRTPQPPREDEKCFVQSITASAGRLKVVIKAELDPGVYQIGLSAIIETLYGQKSFWALKHCQEKPDFHDYGAFTVERKLK